MEKFRIYFKGDGYTTDTIIEADNEIHAEERFRNTNQNEIIRITKYIRYQ